jgi:rod shape-determining protein MreC
LTLLVLVLVSLTVITLDFRHSGPVEKVRDAAGTAFSPVRSAADTAFRPVGNAWHGVFDYNSVKKQNDQLRKELAQEKGRALRARFDQNRYEQLLKAAHITYLNNIPTLTAQVISGPLNNFSQTIEIGRGAGDGIKPDMPVITPSGLVGTVLRVEGGRSIVQLISDPNSHFDATLIRTLTTPGLIGTGHGTGADRPLEIDDGIAPDAHVRKGLPVFTSGVTTSIYPGGIPVGTVSGWHRSRAGTQLLLDLKPSADLNNLAYLTVVLYQASS